LDSTTRELIKAYLEKAAQKLAVARRLMVARDFDDAVSRAYYAAFHAVRALLASAGQAPTAHHGAVILFNLLFVKTGKIAKDVGKHFANLKDDRESVDYELFTDADEGMARVALEEAERLLSEATAFLKRSSFLE